MTKAAEQLVTANTRIPRITGLFAPADKRLTYKIGGFGSEAELRMFAAKERKQLISFEEDYRWDFMTLQEAINRGLEHILI